jgi:hypothetical protein
MQFGKALERILQAIVDANPTHGPLQLIKVDIADGFYCIWLNVHDIPKLAVAIPTLYGEEPLLALPLVLNGVDGIAALLLCRNRNGNRHHKPTPCQPLETTSSSTRGAG